MPIPFAAIAAGVSAVGSLLGGLGASSQAKAQASLYNQQASIFDANAEAVKIRGRQKVGSFYKEGANYLGTIRTRQAKSNLTGVTAEDIELESTQNFYQDVQNLEYDNLIQELNLKNEAIQARYAAKQTKKAGQSAMMSGILNAGGSLVSGFSSVNGKLFKGSSGCSSASKCGGGA